MTAYEDLLSASIALKNAAQRLSTVGQAEYAATVRTWAQQTRDAAEAHKT